MLTVLGAAIVAITSSALLTTASWKPAAEAAVLMAAMMASACDRDAAGSVAMLDMRAVTSAQSAPHVITY